jgi:carboxyl-terminal processing protease
MPMIVLVNYASASASEIVAGAIQDWDKGLIVGDTTFGKGSVQTLLPLDENHHMKMTTAFYYTPSGRCINKPENGIRAKGLKSTDDEDGDGEDSASGKSTAAKDSLKKDTTTYKTKNGRIVYGGGGIIPDTVIKPKIPEYLLRLLFLKDAFFSFANVEYLKLKANHVNIDQGFMVNDAIMADFQHFLDSTHFKFQNQAQSIFEDFKIKTGIAPDTSRDSTGKLKKDTASDPNKPKWTGDELGALKKISQQIDNVMTIKSKSEFISNAAEIKKYVRDALLSREFGPESDIVYRARFIDDVQFQTALKLLVNKSVYDRLLKPKGKK